MAAGQAWAVLVYHRGILLFRHHQVDIHIKAQYGGKSLVEQGKRSVGEDLADKIVANPQHHMLGVFKKDRLQPFHIEIIGGIHQIILAVQLYRVQNVVEGIHVFSLRLPDFV